MVVIHRARLCKICKWEDYGGYGFSLNATRGKVGHFIGDVDPRSPAYAGGIRDNDFVVEVNGINVLSDPHQQVVDRIKQLPGQVTLLVVDKEARKYFEEQHVVVDSYMESLERIDCPPSNPYTHNGHPNTDQENYDETTFTQPNAPSKEQMNHACGEMLKTACLEIETHALDCTENEELIPMCGSTPSGLETVAEIEQTIQTDAVCNEENVKQGHAPVPSEIPASVVNRRVEQPRPHVEVMNDATRPEGCHKQQHRVNTMVQEHVTEEVRSSTRIEIIRESEIPRATKMETTHERTIIVKHNSVEDGQLREAIEQLDMVSSHPRHSNGPISPPVESGLTKGSVGLRENGYHSVPNAVQIEAAPQPSARRESDRGAGGNQETVQSPIESTKSNEHKSRATVKSAILDERPSSLAKSDQSRNASTLDSHSLSSETANGGDVFNQDLMSVKMKCASRNRKNRIPASSFAERKKMFDQL